MLNVTERLPDGLLSKEATELSQLLPGPTLIHLPGRRPEPLFVSVLLHGDETTGWLAVRALLREYAQSELPRALALFIGNVAAARVGVRFLDGQPDFNRIWTDTAAAIQFPRERDITREVCEIMRARGVFAAVDVHNNTGANPHYSCVRRLDAPCLHLATLFSRTVVYFRKPDGVLAEAFSQLCPAVTVECGQPGQPSGVAHALEYLKACLKLATLPNHAVAPADINLFRSVGIVKVPARVSFGFNSEDVDIRLIEDLDRLNFRELPVDTLFGWIRPGSNAELEVWDEHGRNIARQFLAIKNGEIRTAAPVMPSMLTRNERAIRQDCLGYFMERYKN